MQKELHIWMKDNFADARSIFTTYISTQKALLDNIQIVNTTQTHFCSTRWIEKGYKIFVHMPNGKVIEIKLGVNESTPREIREGHNLEKLLLANEFGFIS